MADFDRSIPLCSLEKALWCRGAQGCSWPCDAGGLTANPIHSQINEIVYQVPSRRRSGGFPLLSSYHPLIPLAGVGMAFYYSWDMSLVLLGLTPIVMFATWFITKAPSPPQRSQAPSAYINPDSFFFGSPLISNKPIIRPCTRPSPRSPPRHCTSRPFPQVTTESAGNMADAYAKAGGTANESISEANDPN